MISANCLQFIGRDFVYDEHESTKVNLLNEYERIIWDSLITSFGLDQLLVKDQLGGDVDTIHNVRRVIPNEWKAAAAKINSQDKLERRRARIALKKIEENIKSGKMDPSMKYKTAQNEKNYDTRTAYGPEDYRGSKTNFAHKKSTTKKKWQQDKNYSVKDEYTSNTLIFAKGKKISPSQKAELDHIIPIKEIQDDPAVTLAGLDGPTLANQDFNLAWTNKSLNASKNDSSVDEYLNKKKDSVDKTTAQNMRNKDELARTNYNGILAKKYYTSSKFLIPTFTAAANVGIRMGLRQALGMVFLEIWIAIKKEWQKLTTWTASNIFTAVGNGIKTGFRSAMAKYKELLSKFKEGIISGILASLTTTLCNIFFSTAKNTIRIIRQTWASLVEAAKILFVNPDRLPLGEQFKAALKILSAGISVIAGSIVSELVSKVTSWTGTLGEIISTFCGAFVTGIIGCTAVYILDNNKKIRALIDWLNKMDFASAAIDYFRKEQQQFAAYAAQLMQIDIEQFKKETAAYTAIADQLENVNDSNALNDLLLNTFKQQGLPLPWSGDFNTFMGNRANHLVFE